MDGYLVDYRSGIHICSCITSTNSFSITENYAYCRCWRQLWKSHYISIFWWLCYGPCIRKGKSTQTNSIKYYKNNGHTPNKVVLGFMIATAALSMWISNTASVVVMLPIAMSVIGLLVNDADGFYQKRS